MNAKKIKECDKQKNVRKNCKNSNRKSQCCEEDLTKNYLKSYWTCLRWSGNNLQQEISEIEWEAGNGFTNCDLRTVVCCVEGRMQQLSLYHVM